MNSGQMKVLRKLAEDRNFGRGLKHALQVNKLALRIYDDLGELSILDVTESDRKFLEIAALLHDVGLPAEPHNETGFDYLAKIIPRQLATDPLPEDHLSLILYCVLWHRGMVFAGRGTINIIDPVRSRRLAAILRVADALDRTLRQLVEDVNLRQEGRRLIAVILSESPVSIEIDNAKEKSDLMKQTFSLEGMTFQHQ